MTAALFSWKGTKGDEEAISTLKGPLGSSMLMGDSTLDTVPQEPGQIQVRLRLRAHRQPHQLPLGPESLPRLFRRGEQGAVEAARRDGAGEAVEGPAGCADRCGMLKSYFSPTISDCFDPAPRLSVYCYSVPFFVFFKNTYHVSFPAFTLPAPCPTSLLLSILTSLSPPPLPSPMPSHLPSPLPSPNIPQTHLTPQNRAHPTPSTNPSSSCPRTLPPRPRNPATIRVW